MKKWLILLIFVLMSFNTVWASEGIGEITHKTLKGEVIKAGEIETEDIGGNTLKYQDVIVNIREEGLYKRIKHSISYYDDIYASSEPLKVGDKVYVYITYENGKISDVAITYRNNSGYLWAIILSYSLVIILIGRLKGIKALVSLILTILAVFYMILPGILKGKDPLMVTIGTSVLITITTVVIIAGINQKAIVTIIGTSGGIIIAGLFAILFGNAMHLSGVSSEDSRQLVGMVKNVGDIEYDIDTNTDTNTNTNTNTNISDINNLHEENIENQKQKEFDFKGILFAGMIIGALGACMDVGMSIASALHELKCENPDMTFSKMVKSGMNIGRDMMGTMTNTLILAYTGGEIILMMIYMASGLQLYEILNQEMMLEEILRAIAGSFGLIITIPFTTIVGSFVMCKTGKEKR